MRPVKVRQTLMSWSPHWACCHSAPETLAFVRRMSVGESMLVDPVEVADQAYSGSGEFNCGWWDIRTTLPEPARQWVELLEGRFPRARRR
jgi:hypothetical protein